MRHLESGAQVGGDGRQRGLHLVVGDAKVADLGPVEALGHVAQGVVSTKPNVFEQSPDLVDRGLDLCLRSRQERSEVAPATAADRKSVGWGKRVLVSVGLG